MTDLVTELLQAADFYAGVARRDGGIVEEVLSARAARIRQRAAWVRELEAVKLPLATAPTLGSEWHTLGQQDMWVKLTGPIPAAETAPTKRREP